MKASISRDGILTVAAESELEAYALKQWIEDNMPEYGAPSFDNFIVRFGKPEEYET